jgi:hypothetical protein
MRKSPVVACKIQRINGVDLTLAECISPNVVSAFLSEIGGQLDAHAAPLAKATGRKGS